MTKLYNKLKNIVKNYVVKPLVIGSVVGVLAYGTLAYGNRVGGDDILVNTYTANIQYGPDIAMNKESIIITWTSLYQDSLTGSYAQRFDKEMNKIGGEFRVNSYTERGAFPQVAIGKEGNFVIPWHWSRVKAQRFNNEGNKVGDEFIVNDNIGGDQEFPRIVMGSEGNFLIAFRYAGYGYIYAQGFDKDGNRIGEGFPLVGCENRMANNNEQFIVTYVDSGEPTALYAQRYSWEGEEIGDRIFVSSSKAYGRDDEIGNSSIAMNEDKFIVTWEDYGGVFARIYDKEGNSIGDEFRVNIGNWPDVAINKHGNFVITGEGISAQRFDSRGNRVGDEFKVNSYIGGWQVGSRIVMNDNNDFVITWRGVGEEDDDGIYAKKFSFYNPADLDKDGYVNLRDYAVFANTWLTTGSDLEGDINGDGTVNYGDLEKLVNNWLAYHP